MENKEKGRNLWKETDELKIKIKELEGRILEIERTAIFDTPSPEPIDDTIVHAELVREPEPLENSKEFKLRKIRSKALKSGEKCLFRFLINKYDHIEHPGRPQLPDIPVKILDLHEEFTLMGSAKIEIDDPYSYIYEIEFPHSEDLLNEGYTQDEIEQLNTGWHRGIELIYNPQGAPGRYYQPPKYKSGKNKGKTMSLLSVPHLLWGNHFIAGSNGYFPPDNRGTLHPYKKPEKAASKNKNKKKKSKRSKNKSKRKYYFKIIS